jgi:ribulose-bisphosphate carboxylase large chain
MISNERFFVKYRINGDEKAVREKAFDICVEQTIEFPYDLVEDENIKNNVVGKIEEVKQDGESFLVTISYHNETTSYELTQLINVIFGNISLKEGIKVEKLYLSNQLEAMFKGPRYGVEGLRNI